MPEDPADLFELLGDSGSLSDEFYEALAGLLLEIGDQDMSPNTQEAG